MQAPERPADERERLAALYALDVLDTPRERRFDAIVEATARLLDAPTALISLVDDERQWFKACAGLEATETPRELSFCGHAIHSDEIFEVPDARADPRFADNPFVTAGPCVRFYAGRPLHAPSGHRIGTLCVIGPTPRAPLDARERAVLDSLARCAEESLCARMIPKTGELEAAREVAVARARLYEDIVARMRSGVYVFRLESTADDGAIRLLARNPAADAISGLDTEAQLGRPIEQVFPESYAMRVRADVLQVARSKETLTIERELPRLEGMQCTTTTLVPLGEHVVAAIFDDVTTERAAASALRESEERYRDLFANATDLIQSVDVSGRYQFVNRAWLETLGYDASEIASLTMWDVILPAQHAHCLGIFRRLLAGEPSAKVEATFLAKDGRHVEVEGSVSCRFVEGTPVSTRGIFRDVSARRAAEKMKDEFVSVVSHELRTPLTSIVGSLGLLQSGVAGELSERVRRLVEIASKNGDRLVRLINDILDVEKIAAGRMTFTVQHLDVAAVLQQAIEVNRPYADGFGVTLRTGARLPAVLLGDGDRVGQVLSNLLSNAAKFSPRGADVVVDVKRVAGKLRVSVVDHGVGIPAAFQRHMFDRFSQGDASPTRTRDGSGLGLNISRSLIEGMGGRLGFESVEGQGSTFWFELPEQPAALEGERAILVCEDDPDVADLLRTVLEQASFRVDVAPDGATARMLLRERAYSSMTLDLSLPDCDGLELLRELRLDPRTRTLSVVVVSAAARAHQLDGAAVEVVDWLGKPIDAERLLRAARSCASGAKRARILHVEDDADLVHIVRALVEDLGDVHGVPDLATARHMLRTNEYDLVILDCGLPDGDGLDLLPEIGAARGNPPVLIFSANDLGATLEQCNRVLVKSRVSNVELSRTIREMVVRHASAPAMP